MNDSYRDPLTDMVVNINNLDVWKKRLMMRTAGIPDRTLLNLDIKNLFQHFLPYSNKS